MNIRPLGSDLIVRRDTPPEQTRGGIVIPTISKEQQLYAIVVAVGPEVCVVQVGDRVISAVLFEMLDHICGPVGIPSLKTVTAEASKRIPG